MTDNKTKFRGLMLAALMVLSVIGGSMAFAGSAAAAATSLTAQGADNVVVGESSTTQDVTFDVTVEDSTSDTVTIATSTIGASVSSVSASDGNADTSLTASQSNGDVTVTIQDTNSEATPAAEDATVTVTITYDTTGVSAQQDVSMALTAQNGGQSDSVQFDLTRDTDGDGVISTPNNALVFAGEDVTFDTDDDDNPDNSYVLRSGDSGGENSPVGQLDVGADNAIIVDTSDLKTGSYYITNDGPSNSDLQFEVVEQDFGVSFAETTVGNSGSSAQVDYDVTSDNRRSNFDVVVTSENFSDAEMAAIFGGQDVDTSLDDDTTNDDNEGVVIANAKGTQSADFDASGVDVAAGDYDFTFHVADTSAEQSVSLTVNDVAEGEASLETRNVEIQQGDVAAINVTFSGAADTAKLVIGDASQSGYEAHVLVEDNNNDGHAVVYFNSYTAGTSETVVWAKGSGADADGATLENTPGSLSDALDEGDYALSVKANAADYTEVKESPHDVGTLYLTQRSTNSMQLWTAPSSTTFDADSKNGVEAKDIASLVEDGVVTQDSKVSLNTDTSGVTAGDYLLVQVDGSGLSGLLQDESTLADLRDSNDVAANLGGQSIDLTIEQENPSANREPKVVDIAASSGAIELIEDEENDKVYLKIDTQNLDLDRKGFNTNDDGTGVNLETGEEYNITFSVMDDRLLESTDAKAHQQVSANVEFVEGEVAFDNEDITVEAADNQTISGTSTYAPGTEFTLRVQSTEDTQPRFFKTSAVTVQADGTWSADFNFSAQSENDTFEASFASYDVSAEGVVTAADDPDDKGDEECPTPTATAADGDGDGCPGTVTEEPVTTTEQPETTTEQPPETTTEATPVSETPETETTTADDGGDQSNSPVPGFGVTVAIVALVAAALLALRRD